MTKASSLTEWLEPDRRLDVSGSLCPVPVIEARSALKHMAAGQVLEVLATDPLAELDLAVMCEHLGHRLVRSEACEDTVRVQIEVAKPSGPS
jgi:tRNA 2-thiouridine synthesizing protein A